MTSITRFRLPSTITSPEISNASVFDLPPTKLFFGDWYTVRSSSTFWKDKKNVRMRYNKNGEDEIAFQYTTSKIPTTMHGTNTSVEGTTGAFSWRGKGLMRLFGAKWEILAWKESAEGPAWMITYSHKTLFSSLAINVSCTSKLGPINEDLTEVDDLLASIDDTAFQKSVRDMYLITQD